MPCADGPPPAAEAIQKSKAGGQDQTVGISSCYAR